MPTRTDSRRKRSHDSPAKDPQGGLTAAGRRAFARKDGAHLRPGVRKRASEMSTTEMKRKGSWAVRFYGREGQLPPLIDEHGEPTRFALTAHAWGEPVPRTMAAARAIARRGRALLARAARAARAGATKTAKKTAAKKTAAKRAAAKKTATKKTTPARRRAGKKHPSLVENINARKRAGTSRPKSRSTISKKAYDAMEEGWGKKRKSKGRSAGD